MYSYSSTVSRAAYRYRTPGTFFYYYYPSLYPLPPQRKEGRPASKKSGAFFFYLFFLLRQFVKYIRGLSSVHSPLSRRRSSKKERIDHRRTNPNRVVACLQTPFRVVYDITNASKGFAVAAPLGVSGEAENIHLTGRNSLGCVYGSRWRRRDGLPCQAGNDNNK